MELMGSDMLRGATGDCGLVLLTATEIEAAPLRDALLKPQKHIVATKTLFVGELEVAADGAATDGAATGGAATVGSRRSVRVVLAVGGCDKTNTAHILTVLMEAMRPAPSAVLQVGIAGALPSVGPGTGAAIGDIVLATREIYSDTGSSSPGGWLSAEELGLPIACVDDAELGGTFPLDNDLVLSAAKAIEAIDWSSGEAGSGTRPAVLLGPCVTASRITGLSDEAEALALRWGALAESMEGAAAAHVCALYGVPFLEIRAISNLATDRNRAEWRVDHAVAVAVRAALAVVGALDHLPLAGDC